MTKKNAKNDPHTTRDACKRFRNTRRMLCATSKFLKSIFFILKFSSKKKIKRKKAQKTQKDA
jgi:hypothetical protein